MIKYIRRIVRNQRGAVAIEYGLLVSLIFIAILVGVKATASETIAMWMNVSNVVQNNM